MLLEHLIIFERKAKSQKKAKVCACDICWFKFLSRKFHFDSGHDLKVISYLTITLFELLNMCDICLWSMTALGEGGVLETDAQ